jgi:hypothetical protein
LCNNVPSYWKDTVPPNSILTNRAGTLDSLLVTTMRWMSWILLGLVGVCAGSRAGWAQKPSNNVPTYVNENPKDPSPLKLDGLQGRVEGLGGDAMPDARVSLFTEESHTLVASVNSDRNGKFHFDRVEHGFYRVVALVQGLCPANIPVKIEGSFLAKRKLVITMRPKDIDTCSYGMAKK